MKLFNDSTKKAGRYLVLILLSFVLVNSVSDASGAELKNRKIEISSGAVSALVTNNYEFTMSGTSSVASISFEYCSNSPLFEDSCIAPVGLNVSNFSIASQTGMSGFAKSNSTTNNQIIISRTAQSEFNATAGFSFNDITNPSTEKQIVYVKIRVFDGVDAGGNLVDKGAVVFNLNGLYDISAYVPPYMTFCVGVTVELDCSSTQGELVGLGKLSDKIVSSGTSQFAVSTNDPQGYDIFALGQTLTSGNNVIPSANNPTPISQGVSRFGFNLRDNASPDVGAEPESGLAGAGQPTADYGSVNRYKFIDGDRIASSDISSGFRRYTVSYVATVSADQHPGVYATSLIYHAVASF